MSRRAQIIEPGDVEILLMAGPVVTTIEHDDIPAIPGAWVTGSLRTGLMNRVDLQFVLDPWMIPEVHIGVGLIQRPAFALSVSGGFKLMYAPFSLGDVAEASIRTISFPINVLADIKLFGDSTLTLGVRYIGGSGNVAVSTFLLDVADGQARWNHLGGVASLHLVLGPVILAPEFSYLRHDFAGTVFVENPTGEDISADTTEKGVSKGTYAFGLGLGFKF